MSSARWAPPSCSAACAIAATSSVLASTNSAAPSAPIERRGHAVKVQPGQLAGLVQRRQRGAGQTGRVGLHGEQAEAVPGPADHQDQAAVCPSSTKLLRPSSRQPSPDSVAAAWSRPVSQEPSSSVKASVAISSPEAMPGR